MARAFRISPDSSVPIRSASCRTWIFSASVTAAEILASRLSGITTGPRATSSTRQSATRRLCTRPSGRRDQSGSWDGSVGEGHKSGRSSERGMPKMASYRSTDIRPSFRFPLQCLTIVERGMPFLLASAIESERRLSASSSVFMAI